MQEGCTIDASNDVCDLHNASFLKYLTFIQDVITRMNRNAFQLKGWSITIVAALAALAVDNGSLLLFIVAAVATMPFCFFECVLPSDGTSVQGSLVRCLEANDVSGI